MKTSIVLALAALLSIDASYAIAASHKSTPSGIESRDMQALAIGQPGPSFRGGASCGADRADPVLGANGAVLGYVCAGESANGS